MQWGDRLDTTLAVQYGAELQEGELSSLIESLFEQQKASWAALSDGLNAWQKAEYRDLSVNDSRVTLQHNPGRIISTGAKVDESSIRSRSCFLCSRNMPPEERGLALDDNFAFFCNPFPVLEKHLVIASREHVPQRIADCLTQLLEAARGLGSQYAVIYNGPACGASAPDHVHLQAGRLTRLRILDATEKRLNEPYPPDGDVTLRGIETHGVRGVVMRGRQKQSLEAGVRRVVNALGSFSSTGSGEPMLNALATYRRGVREVVIIPRERHRSSHYSAGGDARVLVSPAAIDLSGLIVTPLRKDFESLDGRTVEEIIAEVTFDQDKMRLLMQLLNPDERV